VSFSYHSLVRSVLMLAVCSLATFAYSQSAEVVASTARLSGHQEFSQKVRLRDNIPDWATAANDRGRLASGTSLTNLHLILARAPQVEAAFQQLLLDQQNPASPRYHQWLTPQQSAAEYGIASSDLAAVTTWLTSSGLSVDDVSSGGVFITFSGSAVAVENAFDTQLHSFAHEDATRYAPSQELAVPAQLSGIVHLVSGLTENYAHVHSHRIRNTSSVGNFHPDNNLGGGVHALSPTDFNTIYDISTPINAGITGVGNHVAILIDSDVVASDITAYKTLFGVTSAGPTKIVLPGSSDPGVVNPDEGEADLDVQRVMGTAPGAPIDLLVFSALSDNVIQSALQYEISTLNDPVVNMSFGACDNSSNGLSRDNTYDSYFATAAGQGISLFASSGDDGAAGCDSNFKTIPNPQVLSTSVICASSHITCVGGTEFNDTPSSSYWNSTNNPATQASVLGYIPEGAWNEPSLTSKGVTTYQASATSGGVTLLPKPTWQVGVGVPADGVRDVPDVSFTAAGHDGYLICQADMGDFCATNSFEYLILGTSASSPSMAGIAALFDQKAGSRQGNLNPILYSLAGTPSNGVFHDVTVASSGVSGCSAAIPSICNNSTPTQTSLTGGLLGYLVTTGYDLATGLGSLDVNNFLTTATAISLAEPRFTLASSGSSLSFVSGATTGNTAPITIASVNGFVGTVQLSCVLSNSIAAFPPACAVLPGSVALTAGGPASAIVTITSTTAHLSLAQPDHRWSMDSGIFFAMLLFIPSLRRRRMLRHLAALSILLCGIASLTGCGGSSSPSPKPGSSAGTYTATITGTGTTTGPVTVIVATTPVQITIN
jgi:subtilase family serine protease